MSAPAKGLDEQDADIGCPEDIRKLVYAYGSEAMRYGFYGQEVGVDGVNDARRTLLKALASVTAELDDIKKWRRGVEAFAAHRLVRNLKEAPR